MNLGPVARGEQSFKFNFYEGFLVSKANLVFLLQVVVLGLDFIELSLKVSGLALPLLGAVSQLLDGLFLKT